MSFRSSQALSLGLLLAAVAVMLILLYMLLSPVGLALEVREGELSVSFAADRRWVVLPGDCVTVHWEVEGVREIFLNNEPVIGSGERSACVHYGARLVLRLTLPDGDYRAYELPVEPVLFTVRSYVLLVAVVVLLLLAVRLGDMPLLSQHWREAAALALLFGAAALVVGLVYYVRSPGPLVVDTVEAGGGRLYLTIEPRTLTWTGGCADVHWDIDRTRAVYFNHEGVAGWGEGVTCVEAQTRFVPTLRVVMISGSEAVYRPQILLFQVEFWLLVLLALAMVCLGGSWLGLSWWQSALHGIRSLPGHLDRLLPRTLTIALAVIALLYVGVSGFLFVNAPLGVWPDTDGYWGVSLKPLLDQEFWAGKRPFTFPLLFKLGGGDFPTTATLQLLVSLGCWLFLAGAVASLMRTKTLKLAGFGLVLLYSLSLDIQLWTKVLLSESLSISLLALLIGAWLLVVDYLHTHRDLSTRAQVWLALGLLFLTALWSFVRDTNPYVLLALAALLVAILSLLLWRRRATWLPFGLVIVLGLVGIFVFQNYTAKVGDRWQVSLVHNLGQRILIDEERTAWFAERGMPTNEDVMRFAGQYGWSFGFDWSGFGDWLYERGRDTYLAFLVAHPQISLLQPLEHWGEAFEGLEPTGTDLYFYSQMERPPFWQNALTLLVYPKAAWFRAFLVLAVALLAFVALVKRQVDSRWIVPLVLLPLAYGVVFAAWHGDPFDLGRHAILAPVQTKFALWLLILICLDTLRQTFASANP